MNITLTNPELNRATTVSDVQLKLHYDPIMAWLDGAEIECRPENHIIDEWTHCDKRVGEPLWRIDFHYRVKKRQPRQGEVWEDKHGNPMIHLSDGNWACLKYKHRIEEHAAGMTYLADDLEGFLS